MKGKELYSEDQLIRNEYFGELWSMRATGETLEEIAEYREMSVEQLVADFEILDKSIAVLGEYPTWVAFWLLDYGSNIRVTLEPRVQMPPVHRYPEPRSGMFYGKVSSRRN